MGEPTTMDSAAKQRVKEALLAAAGAEVSASDETVAGDTAAAELGQESSFSNDDLSQSDEAGELHGLLGAAGEQQAADARAFARLDFGPKTTVGPGAIIAFEDGHYVVGVVSASFECDGVSYEGISTDAPIYASIEGLHAGDTFSFNGTEHTIDLVA